MVLIRPAAETDATSVERLAATFGTSFSFESEPFHRTFSRLLVEGSHRLLVAVEDGCAVGYVLAYQHQTFFANGPVVWVEELMVAPTHRKQGIGRLLMEAVETWARSTGSVLVALATRRAADFYASLGYEESARYFRKILPPDGSNEST